MITKEEIAHVASLAKLKFNDEELAEFTPQMDSIIEMANELGEVDTTGVKPTTQIIDVQNVYREDVVVKSQTREQLLKNVPETKDGFIKVPSILDKEEK